jgi:hypothetical protein
MANQNVTRWLIATVAAMALVAGACGSGDDTDTTTGEVPEIADADDGLPLADDDQPLQDEGPCVEGEPDCEETLDDAPEPQDLPDNSSSGEDTGSSSGMPVNGGLSIAEALASDVTGIVAVHGHLFEEGTGFRLCERLIGLGERYGCDGDQIEVTNIDIDAIPDIVFFEGTTYTEDEITLFGELTSGTLVVDPLVTG